MKAATVRSPGNRALTVFLSALAVLLAAAGILTWMVFSDPYAGQGAENSPPSEKLAVTLAQSALTQRECTFTKEEVNGYLVSLLQKKVAGKQTGDLKIRGLALTGGNGDEADLYIPVSYRGKAFGVSLTAVPSLDPSGEKLAFAVRSVRIGRLPVSPKWAISLLKEKLPSGFNMDGTTIFYAIPRLQAEAAGISVKMQLTEMKMADGKLKLRAGIGIKAAS